MIISLLVAVDENNVIGKDNALPWHLPNDLKYFKNQTWGLPIVMGRKTFESIGKPLAGRKNIVLTRNNEWKQEGVTVVHKIKEAIDLAEGMEVNELFIIGGAELFATTIKEANRLYVTQIHHRFDGDVSFPKIDEDVWALVKKTHCTADGKNPYPHTFQIWERK